MRNCDRIAQSTIYTLIYTDLCRVSKSGSKAFAIYSECVLANERLGGLPEPDAGLADPAIGTLSAMTVEGEPSPSQLQTYYASLESRIGYFLVLGGTRHIGYYKAGIKWPFPINDALRRMENRLFEGLDLPSGAKVLDAGCGVGHVAMQMARRGLRVQGIDIVKNHVQWAQENIQAHGFGEVVNARWMDYHDLSKFEDGSFDGVYTMETLVHSSDPEQVLREFFRVLKPGGSLALWEYEHTDLTEARRAAADDPRGQQLIEEISLINKESSMPGNQAFTDGVLQGMVQKTGFQQIHKQDLTDNVKPMVKLFYLLAYIPWIIICWVGLQSHFVNTRAGAQAYPLIKRRLQVYSAFTAKKPSARGQSNGGPRERRVL